MKTDWRFFLPAIALAGTVGAQEMENPEALKRILPATAAPEGSLELGILTEFSTLNFDYSAFDEFGEEMDFIADDFHSWTTELELVLGLIEDVELAVLLPLVAASFEASDQDRAARIRERNDFGVGDVEIALSYGWESEDETLFALISLGAELPTNTLDDWFGGKTTAGIGAIEFEKYFGWFGFVGGIESIYEDRDWSHEYQAGVALIPNEKVFSQVFFARAPDEGINRIEASVEYLFSDNLSMEWIVSHEISGADQETIAGFGITAFFGESDETD